MSKNPQTIAPSAETVASILEEWVYRFQSSLMLTCKCYGFSTFDAENIVQEVFTEATRIIRTGEQIESPRNWLERVTSCKCINARLRQKRDRERSRPLNFEPACSLEFESTVDDREELSMILGLVDELPFDQKEVVSTYLALGSFQQAGLILNVDRATFRRAFLAAVKTLRALVRYH